jgi:hypothetical protein
VVVSGQHCPARRYKVEREDYSMEQWQIEALQALLETQVSEVEEGQRVYCSSMNYGGSLYHLIDKRGDDIQIEQIDVDEKWSKRVIFHDSEVPVLLKTLLLWYLEDVKLELDRKASGNGDFLPDDGLTDLDTHPF